MIIRNKFNGYVDGNNRLYPGGGGPTTTKSETSNIPEYARPYVERMMGATEKQVYTYGDKGQITGFQPYKPFEGETVAGFTPMQSSAMRGIQNYRLPGQTAEATGLTQAGILGSMNASNYTPGQFGGANVRSPNLQQYQMGPAERVGTQSFVRPGTVEAYMSPYQQAVTDIETREAMRQSNIMAQQSQAQAGQQGAFGGSRSAIVEAERQRNLGQQMGDIQARGSQSAFQQAQQQFNAEQQARMQAAMANQQAGLTVGGRNLEAALGIQQLGAGQNMQAQLANLQARQQAQQAYEQSRQFGAELGLKGYGQAMQGAEQLGKLGQQQYGQEMGLFGQQMEIGGKQQQYEQARLNQIIQDYATQQQYPFIQLGTLSNMLRGLPMQASTTQMYQAQPGLLQQGIGLAGAGANLYQAMKAEGGAIKEMAGGGIASGADPYKLPGMMKKLSDEQLSGKLDQKDTDPETMGIAQAEKQRRDQTRANIPKMAGGGAVAFAKGGMDEIDNPFNEVKKEEKKEEKPVAKKEARAAKAPVSATPYQDMARSQLSALDTLPPEVENVRSSVKELEKRTAGGVEGEMDRQQKLRERFGVDPTKLIAEERARHQEELKLSEEDYRKAQHLRYAQMFARFGSTPGPVLKAALVSINDVVPDLLDDKAKANAVRREIKKAMFELDKSEYQEKKGNLDAASKSHEEAVGRITSLNMELGKMITETGLKKAQVTGGLAEREMAGISAEKTAGISAAASRYAADKREAGETKRAEMRDAAELRKEKERVSRDTNAFLSAMSKWDKENKDDINQLDQAVRFAKNQTDPNIVIMKEQLAKKQQERMAYEAEVRRAFPDARTSSDATPATGGLSFSSPDVEAIANKYK
jgi:hypothetical protein